MMRFVIRHLDGTPPVGFVDGHFHGIGDLISIHDYLAINVPGSPSDGLDQSCSRA